MCDGLWEGEECFHRWGHFGFYRTNVMNKDIQPTYVEDAFIVCFFMRD